MILYKYYRTVLATDLLKVLSPRHSHTNPKCLDHEDPNDPNNPNNSYPSVRRDLGVTEVGDKGGYMPHKIGFSSACGDTCDLVML